ncbi:low molecular weight protein-tyrosine-phosphatase [Candidatus Albibeggiatoa sp. nov. BB20]|uniref:low molecular weight protein-tyrosine-phosphatase n=1 Tax=Candidatus Albibeggiatoa sp. nov. BB20 TaxID=3162723 RepID=UPI0033655B99
MVKVLFVCMGNICRSPTAEGVFTYLVQRADLEEKIGIDSAGTHAYHVGEPADLRSQQAAQKRGIDMSQIRARRVAKNDFEKFDYLLAMDRDNYTVLKYLCPKGQEHKLSMFLDFAPDLNVKEVPDPYYGGSQGFEHVLDLIEAASQGLLDDIRQQHLNV